MTTAHKPTFHPAIAQSNSGGYRFMSPYQLLGSRDLPGQTKIKYRVVSQNSYENIIQRDLKQELIDKEYKHQINLKNQLKKQGVENVETANEKEKEVLHIKDHSQLYDDKDASDIEDTNNQSDEDDEEAELMRELERIKTEREIERKKKEAEEAEKEAKIRTEAVLRGNPLLDLSNNGGNTETVLKRRWDDDIVFRNQARDEPESKKRFINDTIRSDFHRKFMNKYIK